MATATRDQAPELHRRRVRRRRRRRDRGGAQPGHRRGDRRRAAVDGGGRRPRRAGRRGAPSTAGRATTPGERSLALLKLADPIEEHADEIARPRGRQRGQAAQRLRRGRDPVHGRQPALLRGRRAQPGGPGGRRVRGGLHVDDPPRARRRGRPDHALELPADDGRLEDRPRPRRRQHGRAQAGRDHADHHDQAGRAGRGAAPQGRAQRDHRPRRAGGLDARAPIPTWTWSR